MEYAKNPNKTTASQQFQLLVEEMQKVPCVARGVSLVGGNRQRVENVWKAVAQKLNDLGPTIRTPAEWRKVWADLRARTKKKVIENEFDPDIRMTDMEKVVYHLLTLPESEIPTWDEGIWNSGPTNDKMFSKRMRRKRCHEDTSELLQEQVELQRKLVDSTEKRNLAALRQVEALEKLAKVMEIQAKAISSLSQNVIR